MAEVVASDVTLAFRRRGSDAGASGKVRQRLALVGGVAVAAMVARRRVSPLLAGAAGAAGVAVWALSRGGARAQHFEHAVTIGASPDDVFALLEDPASWPRFSTRIVRVERHGDGLRWLERLGPRMTRWWTVRSLDAIAPEHVAWEAESSGITERGYEMFKKKQDGCVRVAFSPLA